jgi:hypothetical protein
MEVSDELQPLQLYPRYSLDRGLGTRLIIVVSAVTAIVVHVVVAVRVIIV